MHALGIQRLKNVQYQTDTATATHLKPLANPKWVAKTGCRPFLLFQKLCKSLILLVGASGLLRAPALRASRHGVKSITML